MPRAAPRRLHDPLPARYACTATESSARRLSWVRVLYVAMTRALRQLEMSHHGDSAVVEQIRGVVEGVSRRIAA